MVVKICGSTEQYFSTQSNSGSCSTLSPTMHLPNIYYHLSVSCAVNIEPELEQLMCVDDIVTLCMLQIAIGKQDLHNDDYIYSNLKASNV